MPSIRFSVPHKLTVEEAIRRIRSAIEHLKQTHGHEVKNLEESWTENTGRYSLQAMGFRSSGSVKIMPSSVEFEGQIPLVAMPFKSKFERAAKEKIAELLS